MITVYFVQHGIAESKDVDETRPVSNPGIDETSRIANTLKNNQIEILKVHHSGKLRAIQTASIFASILNVNEVSKIDGLDPDDAPQVLIDQITEDGVMFVGHLPNIQTVVSKIICDDDKNRIVKFQNSAVACVEIEKSRGSLKWFITPGICQ